MIYYRTGLKSPGCCHHNFTVFFRFQQQICLDHLAVQRPFTGPSFSSLKDAVKRLLPYHTCSGHLPTQGDFDLGQWVCCQTGGAHPLQINWEALTHLFHRCAFDIKTMWQSCKVNVKSSSLQKTWCRWSEQRQTNCSLTVCQIHATSRRLFLFENRFRGLISYQKRCRLMNSCLIFSSSPVFQWRTLECDDFICSQLMLCKRDDVSVLTVDQEFDTVSGFLLKRTKDMVNKYRQLLVRETQVRWCTALFCRCCVYLAPLWKSKLCWHIN